MTQRKLFGIGSIIVLAVIFCVIGCGDGQRTNKTRVQKIPIGSSGSKDIKEKSKILDQVEQQITQLEEAGQAVAQFEDGEYKLESITTHFRYMDNKDVSTAAGIRTSKVEFINNEPKILDAPTEGTGLVANDTDSGQHFTIPVTFTVVNAAVTNAQTKGFFTSFQALSSKPKLNAEFRADGGEFSILDIYGQNAPQPIKDGTVDMRLIKLSQTQFRIRLIFDRTDSNNQNLAFGRTVLLTYSLKANSAAPAPENTNTTPEPTGEPATSETPANAAGLPEFQPLFGDQNSDN